MLSARHYGSLPGLDIAFIKGSVTYHTRLDDEAHLRSGVLQVGGRACTATQLCVCVAVRKPCLRASRACAWSAYGRKWYGRPKVCSRQRGFRLEPRLG